MSIAWIDKERLTDHRRGTFLNLGSPHTARMAAQIGFDWILIDLEHGLATEQSLPEMVLAVEGTHCSPIVRVVSNNQDHIKRALDLGAVGVMIPYISTAEEAMAAASYSRCPPIGCRGVASTTVATGFGLNVSDYHQKADANVVTIVQIETREGVANADAIAAVEGVDVLFVGPLDLSYNLGCPKNFEHDDMHAAFDQVIAACRKHNKAAGILSNLTLIDDHQQRGFTFIAIGSDGWAARDGLERLKNAGLAS